MRGDQVESLLLTIAFALSIIILLLIITNVDLISLSLIPDMPIQTTPLLILISIDGFRHDYNTTNIKRIINHHRNDKDILSMHLRPQFPSYTFPNHYSIITGLYVESHGKSRRTVH